MIHYENVEMGMEVGDGDVGLRSLDDRKREKW